MQMGMAADSDGTLTAVVICEGDVRDPEFPKKFRVLLARLKALLEQPKSKKLKVNKVEPWNSVRVTLSIPKEAAVRLRQLAAEGSTALRALGILSVQLEGDTVISLRLMGQEIVLRTETSSAAGCSQETSGIGELGRILSQAQQQTTAQHSAIVNGPSGSAAAVAPTAGPSRSTSSTSTMNPSSTTPGNVNLIVSNGVKPPAPGVFKSPNTVCPMDGKLPVHVPNVESCEYPFESMTQARVIHRRENTMGIAGQSQTALATPPPPPPYPTKAAAVGNGPKMGVAVTPTGPNVATSSPLLVNLLQNEGVNQPTKALPKSGQEVEVKNSVGHMVTSSAGDAHENSVVGSKCMGNSKQTISGQLHQQQSQTFVVRGGVPVNSHATATAPNIVNSAPVNSGGVSNMAQAVQHQMVGGGGNSVPSNVKLQSRFIGHGNPQAVQMRGGLAHQQRVMITHHQAQQQTHGTVPSVMPQHQVLQDMAFRQTPQGMPPFNIVSSGNMQASVSATSSQSTYNPRWPLKPMDSATKSSFQEFTRYQMQYNLSQQMQDASFDATNHLDGTNSHPTPATFAGGVDMNHQSTHLVSQTPATASGPGAGMVATHSDHLGINSLGDLDESLKDLDALIPSLNSCDFEHSLSLDPKAPFESLLDLDLSDQQPNIGLATGIATSGGTVATVTTAGGQSQTTTTEALVTKQEIKEKQYLINPLTGELEPMASDESASEGDVDDAANFNAFNSEMSNSIFSDDDNSCSTGFSKLSDHSDTERSNNSENSHKSSKSSKARSKEKRDGVKSAKKANAKDKSLKATFKDKLQQGIKEKMSNKGKFVGGKEKERPMKAIPKIEPSGKMCPEKIKLRLKLEKSEPITPVYKADVSFINTQQPKRAQSSSTSGLPSTITTLLQAGGSGSASPQSTVGVIQQFTSVSASPTAQFTQQQSPSPTVGEELRVPPLHISLRGRNSMVIRNSKKDRKKSQSGGDPDDDGSSKKANKRSMVYEKETDGGESEFLMKLKATKKDVDKSLSEITATIVTAGKMSDSGGTQGATFNTSQGSNISYTTATVSHQAPSTGEQPMGESGSTVTDEKQITDILMHSTNGVLLPAEKKRRLSGTEGGQKDPSERYLVLTAPIGSTNVGTLPQHSTLSTAKIQKGNNNNNTVNRLHKAIVKQAKSLKNKERITTTSVVTKEGNRTLVTMTTIGVATPDVTQQKSVLPQGSVDAISEEKFKQKFLENEKPCAKVSEIVTVQSSGSVQKMTESQAKMVAKIEKVLPPGKAVTVVARTLVDGKNPSNSPKRDLTTVDPSVMAQGVRGSPGSQAQGEDSGIESMDALSEKSPHQASQSPQADLATTTTKQVASPKDASAPVVTTIHNVPKNAVIVKAKSNKINNIDDFHNIVDIEAALAKMEGINDMIITTNCDSGKVNGDYSLSEVELLSNLSNQKSATNVSLSDHMGESVKGNCKDMNENKEVTSKLTIESQMLDECCNSEKKAAGCDKKSSEAPSVDSGKDGEKMDGKGECDKEPQPVRIVPALYTYSNSDKVANRETSSDVTVSGQQSKEMLQQLCIEIPTSNDSDNVPRVRTRASSRLESPLDVPKQSPSSDPPVQATTITTKMVQKLSAAAIDKLSPKTANKVVKRKRQGSESSTQSSVSDDTPGRAKKTRKETSTGTSGKNIQAPSGKKVEVKSTPAAVSGANSTVTGAKGDGVVKKCEDSSDSDEPLIEIAGKVRNSKLTKNPHGHQIVLQHNSSEPVEKILRNHKVVLPTGVVATTVVSNSVNAEAEESGGSKNSHITKGVTISRINAAAIDDKISTRRSVRMTTSTTIGLVGKMNKAAAGHSAAANDSGKMGHQMQKNVSVTQQMGGSDQSEARRKTRSAGLDASDNRRRRGSRDSK